MAFGGTDAVLQHCADDDKIASEMKSGLTTVRQPLRLIGETAGNMILAEIIGEAEPEFNKFLPGELILRGSVTSVPTDTIFPS